MYEFRQAGILDPISDTLSPLLYDNPESDQPKLKPKHRKWITDKINSVLDENGYDGMEKWLHLVLTGSLTTYQFSDEADVDVSLFVETAHFPEWSRAEMIGVVVDNIDGVILPGTTYPMQAFVVPPDVTPEELYQPGMRSGYDLQKDEWIVPPEKERSVDIQKEKRSAYIHALQQADKMERLLRYEPDKAITFFKQIKRRRQRDMKAGKGDASDSNVAYKMLDKRGLFDQISEVGDLYIAKQKNSWHFAQPQKHEVITCPKCGYGHSLARCPSCGTPAPAPITLETNKFAWTPGKQNVKKFVYNGKDDQLILGEMGPPEGAMPSHFQLAQGAGIDFADITAMGTIDEEGTVDFLTDKRMNWWGDKKQKQFQAQEALKKILPDEIKGFSREQPNLWNFARMAMAADPYWLENWIERNGPYVYHKTTNRENIPVILAQGILPASDLSNPQQGNTLNDRIYEPRPGFVYLFAHHDVPNDPKILQVDLRQLNPDNLYADEDSMAGNYPDIQKTFNLPESLWGEDEVEPAIPLKDWAEEAGGFGNPSETAWSLDMNRDPTYWNTLLPEWTKGTVAHRGPIPPEAITTIL